MKLILIDAKTKKGVIRVDLSFWQFIRALFGKAIRWQVYIRGALLRTAKKKHGVYFMEGDRENGA